MTLLDLLIKAAGAPAGKLVVLLNLVKQEAPDLAPKVDEVLAMLASAITPDNLVAVASQLPAEIANILKGDLDPRKNPSDLAG